MRVQISPSAPNSFCGGGQTGKGAWLRTRILRVRISPPVPFILVYKSHNMWYNNNMKIKLLNEWQFLTKDCFELTITFLNVSIFGIYIDAFKANLSFLGFTLQLWYNE